MDVPVRAIVEFHHLNFVDEAPDEVLAELAARQGRETLVPTYRSAPHLLHATDWDERVFAYWEGEIRDRVFPATQAYRAIRLVSYSGALATDNAVHRLVSGIPWMLATVGPEARFRMVRTKIRRAKDESFFQQFVELCASHSQVAVSRMRLGLGQETFVLRLRSHKNKTTWMSLDGDQSRLSPMRVAREDDQSLDWEEIPSALIDAWMRRGWIDEAVKRSERCRTPTDTIETRAMGS